MNREKVSPPQTAEASTESNPVTVIEQDEDEDEDDDDWDTFQSFPASTREVITDNVTESREAEDSVLESSSPSVSMEDPTSLPIEHGETSEEVSMSISSTGQRSSDGDLIGERSGMQGVSDQESGNVDIALNEEHATEKEALPGQKRSQITEQVSSQLQLAEVVEDSAIVNSLEDHKPVDESPENQTELMPSDREILDNNADNDHVGEYEEGKEKDTVVKTWSVDDEQRNDSL